MSDLYQHPNVFVMTPTNQLKLIHTQLRDNTASRNQFIFASDRLARLLVEEGLNMLPMEEHLVTTPMGVIYHGVKPIENIFATSIVRAGDIGLQPLRDVCRGIRIGKILIQRNEKTAEPRLYYIKLPQDAASRVCLLFDPMLATGGSACMAINALIEYGVLEHNIIFLNMIAAPEGIKKVSKEFPNVRILTTEVDDVLNEQSYILPGCGDYGDRYFGTV